MTFLHWCSSERICEAEKVWELFGDLMVNFIIPKRKRASLRRRGVSSDYLTVWLPPLQRTIVTGAQFAVKRDLLK